MGLLHAATGSWNIALAWLVGLCSLELLAGLAAGRTRIVRAHEPRD
jgi:cyanate permease